MASKSVEEFIRVGSWKGDPPVSLAPGSMFTRSESRSAILLSIGLFGVERGGGEATLWFHDERTKMNYAVSFSERAHLLEILDSLFWLPPEASVIVNRVAQAVAFASQESPSFLFDINLIGSKVMNIIDILKYNYGRVRGKASAVYILPDWLMPLLRDSSCAYLAIQAGARESEYRQVGLVDSKRGLWLWFWYYRLTPRERVGALAAAVGEKELLDFLIGSEDGSRVARDIADALRQHIARSRIECEVGQRVLGRINLIFG